MLLAKDFIMQRWGISDRTQLTPRILFQQVAEPVIGHPRDPGGQGLVTAGFSQRFLILKCLLNIMIGQKWPQQVPSA